MVSRFTLTCMAIGLIGCISLHFATRPLRRSLDSEQSVVDGVTGDPQVLLQECEGCHSPKRVQPVSRFANGLGQWTDAQCYGCHKEINEVARLGMAGDRGAKFSALPLSSQRLEQLASVPLSYMDAPESLNGQGKQRRFDKMRLTQFLRRPTRNSIASHKPAPHMMAYPQLKPHQLNALVSVVLATSDRPDFEPNPLSGEKIWRDSCQACHSRENPSSGRTPASLSVFSAQWLHGYANAMFARDSQPRTMPVVPISAEDAQHLFAFFGEQRAQREAQVDRMVHDLDLSSQVSFEKPVSPRFSRFMWTRFLRDASCVHCHATSPRASSAFRADADGLKEYLSRNQPEKFWARLEIRAIEEEMGMGAQTPGMPMAGAALPKPLRDAVGRWILDGCKDEQGTSNCTPQKLPGKLASGDIR